MNLGAIFFLLALLLFIGVYLARPFVVRSRRKVVSAEEHTLSALLAERDRIIATLQELDFDNTLGKIPAEDYPAMRMELLQRGAEVLKEIDTMQPHSGRARDAETRIEDAIARRRTDASVQQASAVTPVGDDDIEEMLAARRREQKEKSGGFCPACGKPVLKSDKFCPACGKSIK